MREIKFRAFLGKSHGMDFFSLKDLWADGCNETFESENNRAPGSVNYTEFPYTYHPIMQFTGLKDSKGVDIYEGDVLKNSGILWTVEYMSAAFHIVEITKDSKRFRGLSERHDECEVLGNIYEDKNPLEDIKGAA